jgi:hypothetical protein
MCWRNSGYKNWRAYNDIDGFVEVDDDAFFVNDRDGRNCALGEHMYDVEHRSIEGSGGDGVVGIVTLGAIFGRLADVRADL